MPKKAKAAEVPFLFEVKPNAVEGKKDEYALSTRDGTVVKQFKQEATAHRLCDLLNAAYHAFTMDLKADGMTNPPKKVIKKAKAS